MDGKCALDEFFALYEMDGEEEKFESNTVGGWATEKYGGIPPIGEIVRYQHLEIKIVKATKQKVLKVRAKMTEEYFEEENEND